MELTCKVALEGARQLASVEIDAFKNGVVEIGDIRRRLAPDFVGTFRLLLNVMSIQETKQRAKELRKSSSLPSSLDPSSTAIKRSMEDVSSKNPTKRTRTAGQSPLPLSEPKTPDQPTHPRDPTWMGSTSESKEEENTKALLKQILTDSMVFLDVEFSRLLWQRSGHKVDIFHTYAPFLNPVPKDLCSERDTMKFVLGVEQITAINDGGIGI